MTVKIVAANEQASPAGKLADAELHFVEGALDGLKLIGFSVWERRSPSGRRNVTFPARTYSVNGERRSYALLRPIAESEAQDKLRDAIPRPPDRNAALLIERHSPVSAQSHPGLRAPGHDCRADRHRRSPALLHREAVRHDGRSGRA